MAGVAPVTLNDEYNHRAQAAALVMSVNRTLSHSPTPDSLCYSSARAQAAGSSDLCLGCMGRDSITAYMLEGGVAGHRRWVLYPQTQENVRHLASCENGYTISIRCDRVPGVPHWNDRLGQEQLRPFEDTIHA